MYLPNLISNDGFSDHHQKEHRDFKVIFPNVIVKLSAEKEKQIKDKKNTYSIYNYMSIKL